MADRRIVNRSAAAAITVTDRLTVVYGPHCDGMEQLAHTTEKGQLELHGCRLGMTAPHIVACLAKTCSLFTHKCEDRSIKTSNSISKHLTVRLIYAGDSFSYAKHHVACSCMQYT